VRLVRRPGEESGASAVSHPWTSYRASLREELNNVAHALEQTVSGTGGALMPINRNVFGLDLLIAMPNHQAERFIDACARSQHLTVKAGIYVGNLTKQYRPITGAQPNWYMGSWPNAAGAGPNLDEPNLGLVVLPNEHMPPPTDRPLDFMSVDFQLNLLQWTGPELCAASCRYLIATELLRLNKTNFHYSREFPPELVRAIARDVAASIDLGSTGKPSRQGRPYPGYAIGPRAASRDETLIAQGLHRPAALRTLRDAISRYHGDQRGSVVSRLTQATHWTTAAIAESRQLSGRQRRHALEVDFTDLTPSPEAERRTPEL
jgi:hypothetical protein